MVYKPLAIAVLVLPFVNAPAQSRPDQYALEFTNDHQAIRIEPNALLDFTGDFTVEAWVKPYEDARNKPFKFILSKNFGGTGFALVMIGHNDEQRFQFEANDVTAYGLNQGYNERAFRNQWIHLAAEVKGKQMFLFMNGIWVGSADMKLYPPTNALPLWIGSSPWGSFRGCIDEVRIWKGARSHIDIVQNMHREVSMGDDGLLAEYRFDEGSGTEAFCGTTYGLEGKLVDRIPKSPAVPDPIPVRCPGVPLAPSWPELAESSPQVKVVINGQRVTGPAPARLILGSSCISSDWLSTISGVTVKTDPAPTKIQTQLNRSVTFSKDSNTVTLPIGSFEARVNGKPLGVTVPSFFKIVVGERNDYAFTYYVPLRQTIESLGGKVRWNDRTNTAEVTIR